jgi:hypothetical protein
MGDQIAAHGDKPCAGGRFAHGLQAGVEERKGGVGAASMACLLQGGKALLLIRRRRREENSLPLTDWRGNQLRNFGRVPKRLEVNVAEQERGDGCFGCLAALGWRFEQNWIRCGGRATLRKSRADAQKKASQRDVPSGNGAEDAGCEIAFHRRSQKTSRLRYAVSHPSQKREGWGTHLSVTLKGF